MRRLSQHDDERVAPTLDLPEVESGHLLEVVDRLETPVALAIAHDSGQHLVAIGVDIGQNSDILPGVRLIGYRPASISG